MTGTLVMSEAVIHAIETAAAEALETAGVILASYVPLAGGNFRLLAHSIHMVPEADYVLRKSDRLTISSTGWVPALSQADLLGAVPIWFHTHPTTKGVPKPSWADKKVDADVADIFRARSGSPFYGTLIVSPRENGIAFTAALTPEKGPTLPVDRMWCVGDDWRLFRSVDAETDPLSPIFDRNIRAFGNGIQCVLGDLSVAIVGCGGTGSAVAEQLVRLGVRRLTLMDDDVLSASNVTRVYGSTFADVGRPKVEVLKEHLLRIAPDLTCSAITGRITTQCCAREIVDRDLIFGCTDDNAGRLIMSRLSSFLMVPLIDIGVLLSSRDDGTLSGIHGRVTTLFPGSGCLICRERLDLGRASAELMRSEERRKLEDEGYAPALGRIEPAVVAYTTAVAAAAVNELMERLIGYGAKPRPSEILLRLHDREISGNRSQPRPGHYCDPETKKIGKGVAPPFLEHVWVDE